MKYLIVAIATVLFSIPPSISFASDHGGLKHSGVCLDMPLKAIHQTVDFFDRNVLPNYPEYNYLHEDREIRASVVNYLIKSMRVVHPQYEKLLDDRFFSEHVFSLMEASVLLNEEYPEYTPTEKYGALFYECVTLMENKYSK